MNGALFLGTCPGDIIWSRAHPIDISLSSSHSLAFLDAVIEPFFSFMPGAFPDLWFFHPNRYVKRCHLRCDDLKRVAWDGEAYNLSDFYEWYGDAAIKCWFEACHCDASTLALAKVISTGQEDVVH